MEFDVRLTEQDMIRFNLYHTYSKFATWFATALGVFAFFVAVWSRNRVSGTLTVLYVVIGIFILLYVPLNTLLSAKHRIRITPEVLEPLHYCIDEKGITVSREGESGFLSWEKVFRVVGAKTAIYIYSSRIFAYVIPKHALEGKEEELKDTLKKHLEPKRVRL